jgi:flagellar basal-body rod modification protein FlgD
MTTPISPLASPTSNQSAGPAPSTLTSHSGIGGLLDPTTFLNLLVDELKYQNPLDPTSSSNFMSQIAQLSQVEQLQTVSSSTQIGEASNLIGKTITAKVGGSAVTGVVTGVTNGTQGPLLDVGGSTVSLTDVQQIGTTS